MIDRKKTGRDIIIDYINNNGSFTVKDISIETQSSLSKIRSAAEKMLKKGELRKSKNDKGVSVFFLANLVYAEKKINLSIIDICKMSPVTKRILFFYGKKKNVTHPIDI